MRRRAIIFDDNDLIRFALRSLLDRRGYEVFAFPEPGLCPLHVIRECPCPGNSCCADLIISDVNMMSANGIDFIEQLIQKGCKRPHFGVMSACFSAADFVRISKLGCSLFTKPLDLEKVAAWVEEVERSIPSERMLFDWAQTNLVGPSQNHSNFAYPPWLAEGRDVQDRSQLFREELESNKAVKPRIFGLANHTHTTAAELFRERGSREIT